MNQEILQVTFAMNQDNSASSLHKLSHSEKIESN